MTILAKPMLENVKFMHFYYKLQLYVYVKDGEIYTEECFLGRNLPWNVFKWNNRILNEVMGWIIHFRV